MKLFVNQLHQSSVDKLMRQVRRGHEENWQFSAHATRNVIDRQIAIGAVRDAIQFGEFLEYNDDSNGDRHVLVSYQSPTYQPDKVTKVVVDIDNERISTTWQNNPDDLHHTIDTRAYLFNGSGDATKTLRR